MGRGAIAGEGSVRRENKITQNAVRCGTMRNGAGRCYATEKKSSTVQGTAVWRVPFLGTGRRYRVQ